MTIQYTELQAETYWVHVWPLLCSKAPNYEWIMMHSFDLVKHQKSDLVNQIFTLY